jgi:hypothetical protein
MRYRSTRGGAQPVSFTEAVAQGLAPDGGLYLPEEFPDLSPYIEPWSHLSYSELCFEFFKHFATDLDDADLKQAVDSAYSIIGRYWNFFMAPHWLLRISHCNSLGIFTSYKSSGRDKSFVYWVQPLGTLELRQFLDYWGNLAWRYLFFIPMEKFLLCRRGR